MADQPSTDGDLPTPAVLARLVIGLDPTVVGRLLAAHVDDGRGRCRSCSLPQAGPVPWPCTLYATAIAARDALAEQPRGRRR